MKKLFVILTCMCACCMTALAQETRQSIGINLNYGNDTRLGIGAAYRYQFSDHWRVEPAFNYYFKKDLASYWDLGANMHYLFPVAPTANVYPLAGICYLNGTAHLSELGEGWENVSDGQLAVNLGCGVDLKLSSNVALNFEAKYMLLENTNQLAIRAGLAFSF